MPERVILPGLQLESGQVLTDVPIAFQSWGELAGDGSTPVIVCRALTGTARAGGWWGPLVCPAAVLCTARYFVVCLNVLGSPYGSASPLTENPEAGAPFGPDFPAVTIRDTVRAHRLALENIGVRQAAFALGGSLGAMQAL